MLVTLILSAVMMAALLILLFAGVIFIQDKKYFTSAPRDIYEAVQPKEERFRGAHRLGWRLVVLSTVLFLGAIMIGGIDGQQNGFGLWQYFTRFLTMLLLLKAFDIIFFDWCLLTHSHFFQHFYPETEGCAGYSQCGYNWKSHLLMILMSPVAALGLSWLCTLL